MQDKIKALAITLQVNGKDLECLINCVLNSMIKDELAEYYINAPQSEQAEIIQAYVSDARNKFERFSESYQLSELNKRSFNSTIYLMSTGVNV